MTNDEIQKTLRTEIEAGQSVGAIRLRLAAMLASGVDRDGIIGALRALHLEYRDDEDERFFDTAADLLDFFYGWCAPQFVL